MMKYIAPQKFVDDDKESWDKSIELNRVKGAVDNLWICSKENAGTKLTSF